MDIERAKHMPLEDSGEKFREILGKVYNIKYIICKLKLYGYFLISEKNLPLSLDFRFNM